MPDEITNESTAPNPEPQSEPILPPVEVSELQTAQIPVSEPLFTPTKLEAEPVETTPEELPPSASLPEEKPLASSEPEKEVKPEIPESVSEPIKTESKPTESTSETKPETKQETKSEPEQPKIIPVIIHSKNLARELLVKARNMIQFRKRKKLDKIMTLFAKQTKITNDEVEKFLHVSDATATRYLNTLEKENKIKKTGKTGKSVFYTKT